MDNAVSGAMQGKTMEAAGESVGRRAYGAAPLCEGAGDAARVWTLNAETKQIEESIQGKRPRPESRRKTESMSDTNMVAEASGSVEACGRGDGLARDVFASRAGRWRILPFDTLPYEGHGLPMSFLDVAENYDIFLDHARTGFARVRRAIFLHVKEGAQGISEAEEGSGARPDGDGSGIFG